MFDARARRLGAFSPWPTLLTRYEAAYSRVPRFSKPPDTPSILSRHALAGRGEAPGHHGLKTRGTPPSYLEEIAFKFNNRENPHIFRDTIMGLVQSSNLTFETLVA